MAAIAHAYVEQLTQQTTTSTSYVDVSGASLASSNFVAGQKYLLLAFCYTQQSGTADEGRVQIVHGSTAFADSEIEHEQQTSTADVARNYFWFGVWTAVSGEAVKMQFKAVTGTQKVDEIALFAMRLDADLTENTDWFYNEVTASTTLGTSDSSSNNASVSFTPTAGHDWLVLSSSQMSTTAVEGLGSRIVSTGTFNDTAPSAFEDGDTTAEIFVTTCARVYASLAASTQTFTEKSWRGGTAGGSRSNSKVFALDLNKFKAHANAWTEAEIDLSATSFATQIQTISIDPTLTTDVLVLGWFAHDFATGVNCRHRIQVDATDAPGTQTLDIPNNQTDNENLHATLFMDSMTSGSKTIDFDASVNTAATGNAAEDRALMALTMELATTGQTANPSVVSSTSSTLAPTAIRGAVTAFAAVVAAAASVLAPTAVRGPVTAHPAVVSASASATAPSALAGGVTALPGVVTASGSVPAPTALPGARTALPGVVAAAASTLAPTALTGGTAHPTTVTAASSTLAPSVTAGPVTALPGVVIAASSALVPTALPGVRTALPSVVAAAASTLTPAALSGATAHPATVASAGATLTPSAAAGSVTALPSTVTGASSTLAPTILTGGALTAHPSTVAAAGTTLAPTAAAGPRTATPGVVASSATALAPTALPGSRTAAASTVNSGASTLAPAALGPRVAYPAPIVAASSVLAPTMLFAGAVERYFIVKLPRPDFEQPQMPFAVVGSNHQGLLVSLTNEAGECVNLGGVTARLQGRSKSLPAITLDALMSPVIPTNGTVILHAFGTLVSQANLDDAGVDSADFLVRVRYTDGAGFAWYSQHFFVRYYSGPLEPLP